MVSLIVGSLLGALLHYLNTRVQNKPLSKTQKTVPIYEDVQNTLSTGIESAAIELKSNEAYDPLRQ